jgi:hypothetical protein
VIKGSNEVTLCSLEEYFYPHPDTDKSTVSLILSRTIKTVKINTQEAASLLLLSYAEENLSYQNL